MSSNRYNSKNYSEETLTKVTRLMKTTIGDLKELIVSRKQSFFMYKGIPYDIVDEYEDEGRFYVVGRSDDGEEATEEIMLLHKEQKIGSPGVQSQSTI